MTKKKRYTYIDTSNNDTMGSFFCNGTHLSNQKVVELLNENEQLKQFNSQLAKVNREGVKKVQKLAKENEQLKEDVDYWKQVMSLNIVKNIKNIHWSSD